MKMIVKVFLAHGNPFANLEGCIPKVLHSIDIFLEQGDENSKTFQALNKYSTGILKKPFEFKADEGVSLEGKEATKLFMSDLKYNAVSKDPELAKFKVLVRFDPSNKKLMSLEALCNNIEVYTQSEIDNNYQLFCEQIAKGATAQEQNNTPQGRPK